MLLVTNDSGLWAWACTLGKNIVEGLGANRGVSDTYVSITLVVCEGE